MSSADFHMHHIAFNSSALSASFAEPIGTINVVARASFPGVLDHLLTVYSRLHPPVATLASDHHNLTSWQSLRLYLPARQRF